jgi:membrane protein DedA with SNARE-associated domain
LSLFVLATLPTVIFGLRAYHSFLLLRSAYELGAPSVSGIRPWMTIRYVAGTHRVPEGALIGRLGLAPETHPDTTLTSLAEREGVSPFQYLRRVQQALVDVAPAVTADREDPDTGWLSAIGDDLLAALLVFGYPALGLTLLLGAIGFPLPTGLSTVLAGSLAADARMSWVWAGAVAVTASVLGDVVGYGLGRVLGRGFLERRGHWLGYTPARRDLVERLFDRWGMLTVLLSRTLVSHLSSVVSLLAGVSRYRLPEFLTFATAGRLLWTSAYMGLGYAVGSDLDAATGFLKNLSGFLVSLAMLAGLGLAGFGRFRTSLSGEG